MSFEYLLVDARLADRKQSDLERELNALGAEGWELTTAFGLHNQTFVLMRGVPEPEKAAKSKAKASK